MPAVQRGRYLQSTSRDDSEQFRQLFTETEIAEIMKKVYREQELSILTTGPDWPKPYAGVPYFRYPWGTEVHLSRECLIAFG